MITKERTQTMSLLPRILLFSLIATLTIATACTTQPNTSNSPAVTQTTPSASPSPSASPGSTQTAVKITLPLLDALLAENAFVRELKDKAKVSDEQIESLKRASLSEINHLREINAEETDGNDTDAPTRAAEKLRLPTLPVCGPG